MEDKKKLKKGLPLIPLAPPSSEEPFHRYPQLSPTGEFILAAEEPPQPPPPSDEKHSPSPPSLSESPEVKEETFSPQEGREGNLPPLPSPSLNMSPQDKALYDILGADTDLPEPAEKEVPLPSDAQKALGPQVPATIEPSPEKDKPEESKDDEEEEEEDPYAGLTPEEREIKEREEYTWRFRILRKQHHKNITIPTFTEFTPLETIKHQYKQIIREMALDDNVDTYRTYLFGSWLAIEFVCTQWIGIDLSGFTKYQSLMLHKYDKLLIELGEKSRKSWGANLPVEVRLVGLVLFQAGVFYLIKVVAGKFGCSVADLFSIFMGQPLSPDSAGAGTSSNEGGLGGGLGAMLGDLMSSFTSGGDSASPLAPKPSSSPPPTKMRGPSISASAIRSRRAQKD